MGEGVTNFKVGDDVVGYTREAGAYAEVVLVNATSLAHRPAAISAEVGAAIALVGQTAMQILKLSKIEQNKPCSFLALQEALGPCRCSWREIPVFV